MEHFWISMKILPSEEEFKIGIDVCCEEIINSYALGSWPKSLQGGHGLYIIH